MSAVKYPRLCIVLIAFALWLRVAPTTRAGDATDAQKLYRQNIPGTVLIVVNGGNGSGWVIDRERRLVVTNYHVIEKDDEPFVYFAEARNGRVIAERSHYARKKEYVVGAVVFKDKARDLAIVRLPRLPEGVAALRLAPEAAAPGQRVHAIGNPGASPALWVYSTGTVRQVFTTPEDAKERAGVRIVMTQLPLNAGDSGGPMFDDEGRVIGVSAAVADRAHLMSLAIDVREIHDFYGRYLRQVGETAAKGHVAVALLGLLGP